MPEEGVNLLWACDSGGTFKADPNDASDTLTICTDYWSEYTVGNRTKGRTDCFVKAFRKMHNQTAKFPKVFYPD